MTTPQAIDPDFLKMDLAARIAKCMARQNISRKELAERIGSTKPFVTKLLCGETNLTLETIAKVFNALHARIDFVAAPSGMDEWLIKRQLVDYEESLWPSPHEWIFSAPVSESAAATGRTHASSKVTLSENRTIEKRTA